MNASAILRWLDGKKTYIVAILTGIVAALDMLGRDVDSGLLIALAAAFGITIRHAVDKAGAKPDDVPA